MPHPLDPSDLAQVIRDFPQQFPAGLKLGTELAFNARGIKKVLVAGMGGSALPFDILATYLAPEIEVRVSRDYVLEPQPDRHTLVVISSFSGTTEETISSFEEAVRLNVPLVVVSHGGTLAELAQEKGVPHIELPMVIQPRYATGLFVSSILGVLQSAGAIIDRSREIEDLAHWLTGLSLEATGREYASKIGKDVPVIYASSRFGPVARIWKIKINENAKTQAFWNVFPELNHNEMVGFTNLRMQPAFILLKSPDDHPRIQKRMDIFAQLLGEKGAAVLPVDLLPGGFLFQAFSAIILGDWVSYHLALDSGVDPTPVDMVEEFKVRMKS